MNILIADGDGTLLDTLQRFVRRFGHDVDIASSGLECLAKLKARRPDVLVLDGELLWGGSGGVLEEMQRDPNFSETQIVMISDCWQESEPDSHPPIAAWLRKPYRLHSLLNEIHACFPVRYPVLAHCAVEAN